MNHPLVSIIITTYKRSMFLEAAIESARNQTYRNIEILVMDDNDADTADAKAVEKMVTSFAQQDPRVHYYSMQQNGGAVRARNAGAEKSRGEYLNFLDDDDLLLPQKIEKQLLKFEEIGIAFGMVGGYELIINEQGRTISERKNKISGNVFVENLSTCICQTSVPLIRKDIFMAAHGFGEIPSSQEHYMLARLLAQNPYYDYIDDYVVKIRHYEGPRISNGKGKVKGAILLAEKFKQYYPQLTQAQIKQVEASMLHNVFMAYIQVNDRWGALSYYLRSKAIRLLPFSRTLKMFTHLCLGQKGGAYIRKFMYQFKRGNL